MWMQEGVLSRDRFSAFIFITVAKGRIHVIDMKRSLLVDEKQRKQVLEGKGPGGKHLNFSLRADDGGQELWLSSDNMQEEVATYAFAPN